MRYLYYLIIILLVGTLTGCGQYSLNQPVRPDTLIYQPLEFTFPEVAQQQLSNGMKVYLQEDHELPLVELTLLIEGGDIYDPLEQTGLSQFFAQMLSAGGAGSMTPSAFEAELEAMAAILSVSSSTYGYEISLSLNRADLQRGVEMLATLIRQPRFDVERMELIRTQMLEGIKRKNDNPGSIARRILGNAINHDHPFGDFPTVEEVAGFNQADLRQLHQRFFTPQNCWLAVSGDVKSAGLTLLLEQEFGDWDRSEYVKSEFPPLPTAPDGQIWLVTKDIPQTTILFGHRGVNKNNPDVSALRVANYILGGGGFNSRMMREVRSNRGLAYSVYSYFKVGRQLPEVFIAGTETKTESTKEVVTLMRKLIEQIRVEEVSVKELELAKKSLINSFVFAFSDTHSVVSRKVRLDYYDYPEAYLENYRQEIEKVTVADVRRVASKYLQPDKLQIVLVGNSEKYSEAISVMGFPVKNVALD